LKKAAGFNHEGGEIGFQAGAMTHNFLFARTQQVGAAQPGCQTMQDSIDVIEFSQGHQPVGGQHFRQAVSQPLGQNVPVVFQQPVDGGGELIQGLVVVAFPVLGQKVVVCDIDDNPATVSQRRIEPMFAATESGRCFGKAIDLPVVGNAVANAFSHARVRKPFDIVAE
jgi:hypothetical protein